MIWLFYVLAILSGGSLSLQSGVNAQLCELVGHPIRAAMISFAIGTVALTLLTLTTAEAWPTRSAVMATPWFMWSGGLFGGSYVALTVFIAPKLGAGTYFALMVAGQLATALLLDHFGLLGYQAHPLNVPRVLGMGCLIVGVALIRQF